MVINGVKSGVPAAYSLYPASSPQYFFTASLAPSLISQPNA